jgi:hypothetical protein
MRLIEVPSYRIRAAALALDFARWDFAARFRRFVDAAIGDCKIEQRVDFDQRL